MTKENWKLLSKKQQWDILVALRGPDIRNSEVIKNFTTGVIRRAMSTVIRVGGQLSDLNFVAVPSGTVFKGLTGGPLQIDLDHFCLHTREAAENLGVPVLYVSVSVWEQMVLAHNRTASAAILYKWLAANDIAEESHYTKCMQSLKDCYGHYMVPEEGPNPLGKLVSEFTPTKMAKTKSGLKKGMWTNQILPATPYPPSEPYTISEPEVMKSFEPPYFDDGPLEEDPS